MNIIKIIESYNSIECMICETIENILVETNDVILKEMINDLENDINNKISLFKQNSKVYSEMNRSIEKLIYIKKGLRNNDIDLIVESLNNTLCDVINTRNKYNSENIFIENAKLIANAKLTNKINHLRYIINESYSYTEENVLLEANSNTNNNLEKIKGLFSSKHDKIVARDKKFIDSLKDSKKISADMELEVPDDNNVNFEKLISRYDNFIKNINRDPDNTNKFSDKNGDLKNGLDNYFRTGSARKESGTKKLSGDNAITAVSNMIEYCKAYLNNKNTIISKMDDMVSDNSDVKKESFIIFETNNQEKDNNKDESLSDNVDNKNNEQNKEKSSDNKDNNKNDEKQSSDDNKNDINKNKQIGINTLLTIIEQRYFDYIGVLRSLFKK